MLRVCNRPDKNSIVTKTVVILSWRERQCERTTMTYDDYAYYNLLKFAILIFIDLKHVHLLNNMNELLTGQSFEIEIKPYDNIIYYTMVTILKANRFQIIMAFKNIEKLHF